MFLPYLVISGPADYDRILANPKLEGAIVSAIVTDLDGKTLYEHNSNLHVVPASNQKLLSNAFALWELGPDYRPKTSIWKLPNRVVIDSTGDPLMTYAQLKQARSDLRLGGNLPVFVKESYAPQIPDSWEFDDLPNRYSAPVCAFTFDQGAFKLWSKDSKPVLLPQAFGVRVDFSPSKGEPQIKYDTFARHIRVTGTLPTTFRELDTLALPKPDEAAASIFGKSFAQTEELPQSPPDLVLTGGTTLDMVVACLPPSDNNIAENLLLMGARKLGELGSAPYVTARKRLEDFMSHVVGTPPNEIHVFDGSGLSRHNYVTTHALAKLLTWANRQPTGPAWRAALAQPGKGTLSNRLKGVAFQAKTGSLDMVASLSGYLTTNSGKTVVVSIILNEYSCSASEARGVADELIKAVAAN